MKKRSTLMSSLILFGLIYMGIRHLQKDKKLNQLSALYDEYSPMNLSTSGFNSQSINLMTKTLKHAAKSYQASNNMSPASSEEDK